MITSLKVSSFIFICCLFATSAHAADVDVETYSFTGHLNNVGSVQLFEFNAIGVSPFGKVIFAIVTFETFASDGGTNAAGRVFNPPITDAGPSEIDELSEGFQPRLWLFNSAGVLVDSFASYLPTNQKPGTDILVKRLLYPGNYTLALTNDTETVPNSNLLSDGFCCPSTSQSFTRGLFINNGSLWALDISGVRNAQALKGASTLITRTVVKPSLKKILKK